MIQNENKDIMKEESDKLHISTDEQIELSRKVDWGYQEKKIL